MQKYKVLMISGQYLPEVYGGAEQQCQRLTAALNNYGVSIDILTSRSTRTLPYHEHSNNIGIYRPYTKNPPQILGKHILSSLLWLFFSLLWSLKNIKKYDLIHVHQCKFQAFVAVIIGKLFKKKVLVKIGNAGEYSDFASLRKKKVIGRILYSTVKKNVDHFVSISEDIYCDLRKLNIEDRYITLIPNGICTRKPENSHSKPPPLQKKITKFVYFGRMETVKNLSELIYAFGNLSHLNAQLHLVGDGSLEKDLRALAENTKNSQNIYFKGYHPNPIESMPDADFFISTSLAEGMSNSLLEAMNAGIVPICTPISGSKDIIDDGKNGYLIPGFDNKSISATIEQAINHIDQHDKMSKEAYTTIRSNYDIDIVAKKYIKLYETLLRGKR